MIEKLIHKNKEVATKIREVFLVSYAIEAKLLNAIDFPPLQKPLEYYTESDNAFYGFLKNKEVAGVIQIHHNDNATFIDSLVVSPKFFKQGIASKLLNYVFNTFNSKQIFVETGLQNKPATLLYTKFGFKEIKQWDTDHGIRKIRFEYVR